ncbi:MAG: hypothetical protein HZA50_15065 [Planctomycetes bacterium]|nr:hypothetical protein [Planctomycetota bacterium]
MAGMGTPEPLPPLNPCRKKINRKWMKKALISFVVACGATATATVVYMVMNCKPVTPDGGLVVLQITTTQASQPASQPAGK